MPALRATEIYGTIVWLGRVTDRKAALASEPLAELVADFSGPAGEAHGGELRPSCSRVLGLYPRDTTIRNVRQFSILSQEELGQIAADMGLAALEPSLLGATVVISGIDDFSHVPPSSRLQGERGTTLVVDMENRACVLPGPGIEKEHPGHGAAFKPAAQGRRGVTAWVERPGTLKLGERMRLFVPDQPAWRGQKGRT